MQRNDKFMKKKPDEDLNNVILATIQNCIKTDLNWKEIRGKKYRLYSGNIRKPLMMGSNGMGIVFLKDGDQESARLYVDYILKASGEPENRAFDIIKN